MVAPVRVEDVPLLAEGSGRTGRQVGVRVPFSTPLFSTGWLNSIQTPRLVLNTRPTLPSCGTKNKTPYGIVVLSNVASEVSCDHLLSVKVSSFSVRKQPHFKIMYPATQVLCKVKHQTDTRLFHVFIQCRCARIKDINLIIQISHNEKHFSLNFFYW